MTQHTTTGPQRPPHAHAARHAYEANRARIASLWAAARPIMPGAAAALYLQRQGVQPGADGTWPGALRLHPALDYWYTAPACPPACRGHYPALLVPLEVDTYPEGVRCAPVPHVVALQRFYLTPVGELAPVPQPIKRTGAAGQGLGASARLAPVLPGSAGQGVAVGLHQALRLGAATRLPVWAVPDAAALAKFRWARTTPRLYVFVDPDEPAQWRAAAELCRMASACGLQTNTVGARLDP